MAGIYDWSELFTNTNEADLHIEVHFPPPDSHPRVKKPTSIDVTVLRNTNTWILSPRVPDLNLTERETNLAFEGQILKNHNSPVADFSDVFAIFRDLSRMFYIGPFRNAINVGTRDDYFDIKVGEAFFQRWKEYQTGSIKAHNERVLRLTKDIARIFRLDDLQIYPAADNRTLQIFLNGKSYKLPELGSGLAQFILVLGNLAAHEPTYLLIDEPELSLHPSLQIDFLTTLGSYATKGVFFSTHNLGLARASADRIYSLRQISDGDTEIYPYESTPRLAEFLGELSFSGYQELGFNRVLLVEGNTDIKTMQQFLRLYRKEHEVVILPLGGSQQINGAREDELNEVKRITGNVFALIDSEKANGDQPLSEQRTNFTEICKRVGIDCWVLERRATENYLSERAVKIIKGDKYRVMGPYEKLKDVTPCWAKDENWRIAREMTLEEIDQTDLGQFLRKL